MATVVAFESEPKTIPGILAGADLSDNQYYAVKFSSGLVVICTSKGESPLGILQNAPDASGKGASVAFSGIGKAKIGGVISQMNRLVTDTDAMLINQTDPDEAVIAMALSDGVDGDIIPVIYTQGTALNSAVVERALANTKIWIGDSAGEAQAFALSGHATMTAGGVVTVTDIDTTAASDASGDLIYRDAATTFERLAKGTGTQILAMNAGATAPEWIAQSAITSATQTDIGTTAAGDTTGDLIYRDASTTFERLAIGTAAQILATNGGATAPEWIAQSAMTVGNATTAATATDVATTAAGDAIGDLLYRDAAATLERLAIGTAAQILATNGGATAPEWIAQSAMTVGNATAAATATDVVTTAAGDAIGDLLYRDAAATLERLAIGTASQILQTNAGATAPEWNTLSGDGSLTVGVLAVNNMTIGADASGDINYKTAADTSARLAIGAGGNRLTVNGAGTFPVWDNNKIVKAVLAGMNANDDPILTEWDWTAAPGTTGALCRAELPCGTDLGFFPLGAGQTILGPVGATDGIDVACDQTDDEGIEVFSNAYWASGKPLAVGRDLAFYFLIKLNIQLANGSDDWFVGFRRVETVNADAEAYNTYFGLGCNTVAAPALLKVRDELNGGGATNTTTTQSIASATDLQIKVLISAAGVATVEHDVAIPGTLAPPTATHALTFDDGDRLMPYFRFLHATAAQAGTVVVKGWEVGYQ